MAAPQQSNSGGSSTTSGMEKRQTYKVICEGGLNSNQNYIQLSDQTPGSATTLLNFEPSLFGGYRRIDGFAPLEPSFPTVDSAGAEGAILGIDLLTAQNQIIVARKTKSVSTYKFYKWNQGSDWTAYTTGLTHTVTNVKKLRSTSFNFDGTDTVCFVDGINNAVMYNGTSWVFINPTSTGADFAHAGGNQAISAPSLVTTFFRCLFIAGDSTFPQIISYSAPNAPYNFTAASGGGQINAGFRIKQIKAFRESLYVFGDRQIKVVTIDPSNNFVIKDISSNIGCLATDSVVEVNGDLMFLAQDGFRTLAGTNKIGDVDIASQSKSLQQDVINTTLHADFNYTNAVVIRRKSQVRFFFSDPNLDPTLNIGILGGLRGQGNINSYTSTYLWEWSLLRGIATSCCTSGYIGPAEYVLHGGFDGNVYRQENGNSFNGNNILAIYATPYFDMGEVYVRKTLDRVAVFLRPEGSTILNTNLTYNYGDSFISNPAAYPLNITNQTGALYGSGVYGTSSYASAPLPLIIKNIEGSGLSHQFTFSTNDMNAGYSIQAILIEFSINGRK